MAKSKVPRNHDINAGEKLPERIVRVDDMEIYKENLAKVLGEKDMAGLGGTKRITLEDLNAQQKPVQAKKPDAVKAGDLVYVGGHIEEVEEVLDKSRMIVLIRGSRVGGCRLLPRFFQVAWVDAKAILEID